MLSAALLAGQNMRDSDESRAEEFFLQQLDAARRRQIGPVSSIGLQIFQKFVPGNRTCRVIRSSLWCRPRSVATTWCPL